MLYHCVKKSYLLLVLIFATSSYCRAQLTDSIFYRPHKTYLWAGGEIGSGTYSITMGGSGYALFNNRFIIGIKAQGHLTLSFPDNNEVDEFALMAGFKLTHNPYGNLFLLTGASLINFIQTNPDGTYYLNGSQRRLSYTKAGLPISLKYLFSPNRHVGLDVAASANINGKRNLFNVTVGASFGLLRSGGRATRWRR